MAGEEHKPAPSNPWEPVIFIIGAFALGAALIWQRGGFDALKGGTLLVNPPQELQITPQPTNVAPTPKP